VFLALLAKRDVTTTVVVTAKRLKAAEKAQANVSTFMPCPGGASALFEKPNTHRDVMHANTKRINGPLTKSPNRGDTGNWGWLVSRGILNTK